MSEVSPQSAEIAQIEVADNLQLELDENDIRRAHSAAKETDTTDVTDLNTELNVELIEPLKGKSTQSILRETYEDVQVTVSNTRKWLQIFKAIPEAQKLVVVGALLGTGIVGFCVSNLINIFKFNFNYF